MRSSKRLWLHVVSALGAASVLAGCGSDNPLGRKPLSGVGVVTLDGSPLQRGNIEFHPLVQSGGRIETGRYSIAAPQRTTPGKHRVVISEFIETRPLPPGHMPGDSLPPSPKSRIPPDWNDKGKHEVEVKQGGPFKFDFDVVTKKK